MASVGAADPSAVGEWLLRRRDLASKITDGPLRLLAEVIPWDDMPVFAPNDSLVRDTHRRYHDELQERARAGDRYASSLLLGHNPNDGAEE